MPQTLYRLLFLAVLVWSVISCSPRSDEGSTVAGATTLIVNARIVDGTGAAARSGAIRLENGRIIEVGALSRDQSDDVIDAGGLVLAPGFIDTHSHHDDGLFEAPDGIPLVTQGITTIITGQDGSSDYPLVDLFTRLETAPTAINVGSYMGHNTLRKMVMGDDFRRPANPAEIEAMRSLLEKEQGSGAHRRWSGREYDPGN